MKRLLITLGLLVAASTASAQITRLPFSEDGFYKCFTPHIGASKNGAWLYYFCDPYGQSPIEAKSKIIWIASPYPIRFDLVGARLETIKNSTDQLKAANTAWKRYVIIPHDDPSLAVIKQDMIKEGIPIKP